MANGFDTKHGVRGLVMPIRRSPSFVPAVVLLTLLSFGGNPALAISQFDAELLTLLRTIRQNTIASAPSGRGLADLSERSESSGLIESIGPATGDFFYSGNDNIFLITDTKSGHLIKSRLFK